MRLNFESDDSGVTVNGYFISKNDIRNRRQLELDWFRNRFDDETRNNAANDLVSALLASCDNHAERIELSVNLLGYDPR